LKVLYHANCNDGSGAALAAWKKLGDAAEYIPVQYGSEPPEIEEGEKVYIVDFSYNREQLMRIADVAGKVIVIDHHKTAQDDLSEPFQNHSNIQVNFDMERSGAVMAWEYFHDEPVPKLLLHIQDRDLWRFEMEETKDIATALRLYPYFRNWLELDLLVLCLQGASINGFLDQQADIVTKTEPRTWDKTGDLVPIYNLPGFMISDTLHMALEKYPECDYAVAYFDLPDKRVYSLRSRSGGYVDVSAVAKRYGGGGHKHAAGFTVGL